MSSDFAIIREVRAVFDALPSARVESASEVARLRERAVAMDAVNIVRLCDSHEALRAEIRAAISDLWMELQTPTDIWPDHLQELKRRLEQFA